MTEKMDLRSRIGPTVRNRPEPLGYPRIDPRIAELRTRVAAEIERLTSTLHAGATTNDVDASTDPSGAGATPNNVTDATGAGTAGFARDLHERIRLLGQIAAGLALVDPAHLPPAGAGFGSTVIVCDLDTGEEATYRLMAGDHLDIAAGHVSLASPVGQALIGKMAGDIVVVETPHRKRRLELRSVIALGEMIGVPDA